MIFAIIGGVGSGKSVSTVKHIFETENQCFANFGVNLKHCTRLLKSHIINEEILKTKKDGTEVKKFSINWEFWQEAREKGDFSIFIDEAHNLFNSRLSMTKWNCVGMEWISQIRKILGSSEKGHIFLITQRIGALDVSFRHLLHGITFCEKVQKKRLVKTEIVKNGRRAMKELPLTYVVQYHFFGDTCVSRFENWQMFGGKLYDFKTYFRANNYYRFYDSYEIIGESAYL